MKIPESYKCDICGKAREDDSNHWFVGQAFDTWWQIQKWSAIAANATGEVHLCGQSHVIEWLSGQIGK